MKLKKFEGNPILSPNPENTWENLVVCNPAACYKDGKFYLLYRAAGNDAEHYIHIGLAVSEDGFNFKRVSDKPILSPTPNSFDAGSVEDPRIVKFDDEYYITYAFRPYPPGRYWENAYDIVETSEHNSFAPKCLRDNIGNTALAVTKNLVNFKKVGRLTHPSLDDRDVIIFPEKINGKFYMLHRPKNFVGEEYGTAYPSIWIKSSDDLMSWDVPSKLLLKGLLDLDDPTKVLYKTRHFIMEPETGFEKDGLYKWGVVFPTGTVVLNDDLYVYYGASDQWCCVATCKLSELVDFVKQDSK